jgi:hypothetical protein
MCGDLSAQASNLDRKYLVDPDLGNFRGELIEGILSILDGRKSIYVLLVSTCEYVTHVCVYYV